MSCMSLCILHPLTIPLSGQQTSVLFQVHIPFSRFCCVCVCCLLGFAVWFPLLQSDKRSRFLPLNNPAFGTPSERLRRYGWAPHVVHYTIPCMCSTALPFLHTLHSMPADRPKRIHSSFIRVRDRRLMLLSDEDHLVGETHIGRSSI